MDEPAVEKISDDTRRIRFRSDCDDAVGADAGSGDARGVARLFACARTPQTMAAAPSRIQKLIYPVSFYRVKART
jgi:hypothetical protein